MITTKLQILAKLFLVFSVINVTLKFQEFYAIYPGYIIIFLLKLQLCVSVQDYKVKFLVRMSPMEEFTKLYYILSTNQIYYVNFPASLHQTTSALSPVLQVKLHSHILLLCVSVVALVLL